MIKTDSHSATLVLGGGRSPCFVRSTSYRDEANRAEISLESKFVDAKTVTKNGLTLRSQNLENLSGGIAMKRTALIALIGLMTALSTLHAQVSQSLSITGPNIWNVGQTGITLSVTDTFSGYGSGSWGLSYWLELQTAIAPFISITGVSYFTFTDPNYAPAPTFPVNFTATSGADAGYLTTRETGGQMRTVDLGGTGPQVTDGQYHITDITFSIAGNAPIGIYTMQTTFLDPRQGRQVPSDFNDTSANAFPQASFVICTFLCPEPNTLALLGVAAVGSGIVAYRRRKQTTSQK